METPKENRRALNTRQVLWRPSGNAPMEMATAGRNRGMKARAELTKQGWNVTPSGARDVIARIKKSGGDAAGVIKSKKGSGRTADAGKVAKVKAAIEGKNDSSIREISRATGAPRSAAERILKDVLKIKCLTKVKTQRIKPSNAAKRAAQRA